MTVSQGIIKGGLDAKNGDTLRQILMPTAIIFLIVNLVKKIKLM